MKRAERKRGVASDGKGRAVPDGHSREHFSLDSRCGRLYPIGMRILLVNPWITDFAAFDLWAKPLGLLTVGAFLRARGHDVRLVDCMHRFQGESGYTGGEVRPFGTGKFLRETIPKPKVLAHVPRHWCRYGIPEEMFRALVAGGPRPDAVLVTCVMTYWYPGAFEAIRIVREMHPGVPVALGGIYAALCTDHARSESGADRVITAYNPSGIVPEIESLAGHEGNGPVTEDAFRCWPEPLWDRYEHLPAAMVMTSRGCPMRCTVCASRLLCPDFERKDPHAAASEILRLAARGALDIAFADDALLLDAERHAAPLFEELAAAGAPVRLHTPNGLHVREITPELALLMRRAGMRTVRLGLETASEESARERYSAKVSRERFALAVEALRSAGFPPDDLGAYVLAGVPGQPPEEAYETVDFSLAMGVRVRPALFSPVPGTVEFGRAVQAGMIPGDGDPLLQNNTLRTVDLWGDLGGYDRFRNHVTEGNGRVRG
jgi:hypothetical protein